MKKIWIWVLAGGLLLSCAAPQAASNAVNTAVLIPTIPIPPTDTVEPPTATPQAVAAVCPEGWTRREGRNVDMCLPVSWEGGSDDRLDQGIAKLNTMGADGQRMASAIQSARSSIIFWAFDTTEANVATNVNIGNDPVSMPITQFMEGECQQLPAYYEQQLGGTANCLEHIVIAAGSFKDVGRVTIEETLSGINMKAVQYIIKQGQTYWEVTFTTDLTRFAESFAVFETAIGTLNISQP